jgi:glucokinase
MENAGYVLAGDVGGTNLRIAAVDPAGTVLHLSESSTPRSGSATDIARAIAEGAKECRRAMDEREALSFGLALPALINSTEGKVLSSPNLPQLDRYALAAAVETELRVRTVLENDATAAAIGEHWLGSTRSSRTSVFVTLGTGIGGGLVINGEPYRGIDGTAGEIGHICVVPDGIACGCGSHGCVEQYASATAIARIATELAGRSGSSLRFQSAKDVFDAAAAADADAIEAFRLMGRYLGLALAALVNVLNPETIAIGGGAAGAWDFFIEDVRSEINARAFAPPAKRAAVVRATLGRSAGILGAARVAFDSI